jgi:hypothetical protein
MVSLRTSEWSAFVYGGHFANINCKALSVRGRGSPEGCETSMLRYILENRLIDGGEVVSLTHQPHFTPPGRFLMLISVRG